MGGTLTAPVARQNIALNHHVSLIDMASEAPAPRHGELRERSSIMREHNRPGSVPWPVAEIKRANVGERTESMRSAPGIWPEVGDCRDSESTISTVNGHLCSQISEMHDVTYDASFDS
jgi:hypothetical protein